MNKGCERFPGYPVHRTLAGEPGKMREKIPAGTGTPSSWEGGQDDRSFSFANPGRARGGWRRLELAAVS